MSKITIKSNVEGGNSVQYLKSVRIDGKFEFVLSGDGSPFEQDKEAAERAFLHKLMKVLEEVEF